MVDYAMFTDFGNDAVDAIVTRARVLKFDWPTTRQELKDLADRFPNDFGETTDTAVREMVYLALGYTTDFYAA
jgi:hypothetical protein